MTTDNNEALRERLGLLKEQHKTVDTVIHQLLSESPQNQLELSRLKKQKLHLKDQITSLEGKMLPDIIA